MRIHKVHDRIVYARITSTVDGLELVERYRRIGVLSHRESQSFDAWDSSVGYEPVVLLDEPR